MFVCIDTFDARMDVDWDPSEGGGLRNLTLCHTTSLDDAVISSEEQRYEQSDSSTQPCLYHSPSPPHIMLT